MISKSQILGKIILEIWFSFCFNICSVSKYRIRNLGKIRQSPLGAVNMHVNADAERYNFLYPALQRWFNRGPTPPYLWSTHPTETSKICTATGGENKVPSAPKAERYARLRNQRGKIREQQSVGHQALSEEKPREFLLLKCPASGITQWLSYQGRGRIGWDRSLSFYES